MVDELLRLPAAARVVGVSTDELLRMIDAEELEVEVVDGIWHVRRAAAEAAARRRGS